MARLTRTRTRALVIAAIGASALGLIGFAAGSVYAAPGIATVGADGWARFTVSPDAGAATVWVEVEAPAITASDVRVRLNGTNQPVTTTVLGAIAVVPASGLPQQFAVALTTGADPDIAVTVIDSGGTILSSTAYHLTLVDYRTLPQTAAPGGFLAFTGVGIESILLLAGIAVITVAFGFALWRRGTARTTS